LEREWFTTPALKETRGLRQVVPLNRARGNIARIYKKTKLLILLDEFARLGRATTIAAGFSYVAGYGIRLLPLIQSRSQLRAIYGKDTTDEMIANCGVEVVFTPKELDMANEIAARLGTYTYKAQGSSQKVWGNDRSTSTSDQRRALLMPQELMQFPKSDLILLRGGIPPVRGTKATFYTNRTFVRRTAYKSPAVVARPIDNRAVSLSRALIEQQTLDAELVRLTEAESASKVPIDPARLTRDMADDAHELELRSRPFD
jgi:type IV secretion system protein VirD4